MLLNSRKTKEIDTLLFALQHKLIRIPVQECAPTVILFPQILEQNINAFKEALLNKLDKYKIYLAHKATKQTVFIQKAHSLNIGIDVASEGELRSALENNYIGTQIEATGAKTNSFLIQLVENNVLINADSIDEVKRIITIKESLYPNKFIKVGIRIGGISDKKRNLKPIASRFGIDSGDFPYLLNLIKNTRGIQLTSIHFHSGRIGVDEKKSFIPALIELVKLAFQNNQNIEELNIGGGFREKIFENALDWEDYITSLEEKIHRGEPTGLWDSSNYGLNLSPQNTIVGRSTALSKGNFTSSRISLDTFLDVVVSDGQTLSQFLNDLGIALAIEPGYSALNDAGVSIFSIIETKRGALNNNFIVVGGSHNDLSLNVREYLPNPTLISFGNSDQEFEAYVVGLLCKEEDIFINRKLKFSQQPLPGDFICFSNTAAYRCDFENSSPHMRHEMPVFIEASMVDAKIQLRPLSNQEI